MSDDERDDAKPEEVTDLSNSDVVTKYKMAGDILNQTLLTLVEFVKDGSSVVEVCEFADGKITELSGNFFKNKKNVEKGVAFPCCVSVNEVVCHCSPLKSEDFKLKAGDVVKLDIGCHVDGYIVVAAHTMIVAGGEGSSSASEVTGNTATVMKAADVAAEVAAKLIAVGNTNTQVTSAIEQVAKDFGVNAVQGVLMHEVKRFVIDGSKVVLLRKDVDQKVEEFKFEANEVYTVDVAMSSGDGKPKEKDARTTVFKRCVDQQYKLKMKASRYVLSEVNKRFPALPFTVRALEDESLGRMGVIECVKHELLQPYPVLTESAGAAVAHVKFTVLLMPSGTAKITGLSVASADAHVKWLAQLKTDKVPSEETQKILDIVTASKKKKKNKKKKAAAKEESSADAE
jgi:curved DNA binding protein